MPTAMDLPVTTRGAALRQLATQRERIRIFGVVVASGSGAFGTYRNKWLMIRTAGVTVQLTARNEGPLGTAAPGTRVDVACTLTGLVDVAEEIPFAKHAGLLDRQ